MRKPDEIVREVVCSETGKPMAKIPLWMADVKVKFVSDEARQKHPALPSLADVDRLQRGGGDIDGVLKDMDVAGAVIDDGGDIEEDAEDETVEEEE